MRCELAVLAIVVVTVAACGSDDGGVSIERAWARASAEGQTTGAIYFEITAAADDTLLAVAVPGSVAVAAEIHEVAPADTSGDMSGDASGDMSGDDMGDMHGDDGEMAVVMQQVDGGLALPAGETVNLEPGSYHVMLLDIAEQLEVGDEIELSLDFANAEDTTVTVEVAESAP